MVRPVPVGPARRGVAAGAQPVATWHRLISSGAGVLPRPITGERTVSDDDEEDNGVDIPRAIEQVIDKAVSSAEEIHRAVGELPVTVLENLGLQDAASSVKKIQDRSISALYRLIRTVNHQAADLAVGVLELRRGRDKSPQDEE
jgi:hypothetical protein